MFAFIVGQREIAMQNLCMCVCMYVDSGNLCVCVCVCVCVQRSDTEFAMAFVNQQISCAHFDILSEF